MLVASTSSVRRSVAIRYWSWFSVRTFPVSVQPNASTRAPSMVIVGASLRELSDGYRAGADPRVAVNRPRNTRPPWVERAR